MHTSTCGAILLGCSKCPLSWCHALLPLQHAVPGAAPPSQCVQYVAAAVLPQCVQHLCITAPCCTPTLQDGNPIPRPVPAPRAPRAPREPKPPREPRQVKQPPAKRRKAEEAAAGEGGVCMVHGAWCRTGTSAPGARGLCMVQAGNAATHHAADPGGWRRCVAQQATLPHCSNSCSMQAAHGVELQQTRVAEWHRLLPLLQTLSCRRSRQSTPATGPGGSWRGSAWCWATPASRCRWCAAATTSARPPRAHLSRSPTRCRCTQR